MSFLRSQLRYAHIDGYTYCRYTEKGDQLLSCGCDGDVRIYKEFADDDPFTICTGDTTLCIAQYDQRLLASTDLNTVQAYTFPECDRDGTEFRFTGTVTCIKVNKKYIAACSEDMIIKVVRLDKSEQPFELVGHDGIVLSIDLSPKGFLASSSGDGTIRIWNLDDRKVVKEIKGLAQCKSIQLAKTYITPTFEPIKGAYLAYPQKKEIVLLKTDNWEPLFKLEDPDISSEFSTCEFSPCGKYVAAGTYDGDISIWELKTRQALKDGSTVSIRSGCITNISWNPNNNGEIIYCDATGQMGFIKNSYGTEEKTTTKKKVVERNFISDEAKEDEDDIYGGEFEFHDELHNSEDEANENCVDIGKLKKSTLGIGLHNDDDDDIQSNLPKDSRPASRTSEINFQKSYELQPPFQPGSTPEHLDYRYMVWNHVGMVRAYKLEESIDLTCHDASVHCGLHIKNDFQHTMASLSTTALALSCDTKLVCIVFGASAGSREWSTTMPQNEFVLAVAVSDKLVAVATDLRFLRIFGVMGTQREVIAIPGPVISMAAYENKIMVAYHSAPATEDQHINLLLIQTCGYSLRSRDIKIPLTPATKLSWLGFSDKGSPVICDSFGLLKMFNYKSNLWFPVCDTNAGEISDTYFIVEVSESSQLVRAVKCRGANYPLTTPTPLVGEIPMQLPLCELDAKEAEKCQNEEKLVRLCNFDVDDSEKLIKEAAIKLFAISCQAEMEARAKEIIEMIALPQVIPLAIRYSSKLGRMHLTEKLQELLTNLEEKERNENLKKSYNFENYENNYEMESEETTVVTPIHVQRKLQINRKKESAPSIAPKPITKPAGCTPLRNPFKRLSSSSGSKSKENPLSHLTKNVIGFIGDDDEEKKIEIPVEQSQDLFESQEDTENAASNTVITPQVSSTTPMNFMTWYNLNKEDLKIEFPDATPAELTKHGMKRYKALNNKMAPESPKPGPSGLNKINFKRKLDDDNCKPVTARNGITKLAKFNFVAD